MYVRARVCVYLFSSHEYGRILIWMEIRWGYTGKLPSFPYIAVCQARVVPLEERKQEVKENRSDLLSKLETREQRRDC